jgi:triosephosphate isomerase
MAKKTIRDLELAGRTVLMRVDFNVPLAENADGSRTITDETRIQGAVPTIRYILEKGAKLILMSHLGRPKGAPEEKYSLAPVAKRLGEVLSAPVHFATDCVGESAKSAAAALKQGEVLLLENVRFHKEETDNDDAFAKRLSGLGDVYVNDAFGTAHRAHASTAGIAAHMKDSVMGFLMEKELQYLQGELADPARPFVVILGGAKVSDKIGVIKALMGKADTILIGGAMAYTFRKAQGCAIGDSLVENDKLDLALELIAEAGDKLVLPTDGRETQDFKGGDDVRNSEPYGPGKGVADGWEGIDIGPASVEAFRKIILGAKTIIWNGPMGVFENDNFAHGTKAIAEAVAEADAVSIIGGGDSVTAIKKFGLEDEVTFISTGGGASLELLEGLELPGVAALDEK